MLDYTLPLADPHEETFAQERARGRDAARAGACIGADAAEARRLERLARVAERMHALKTARRAVGGADLASTVAGLLAIARGWEPGRPGVEMRESRLAWLDAHRLYKALEKAETARGEAQGGQASALPHISLDWLPKELNSEEWAAKYGARDDEPPLA